MSLVSAHQGKGIVTAGGIDTRKYDIGSLSLLLSDICCCGGGGKGPSSRALFRASPR